MYNGPHKMRIPLFTYLFFTFLPSISALWRTFEGNYIFVISWSWYQSLFLPAGKLAAEESFIRKVSTVCQTCLDLGLKLDPWDPTPQKKKKLTKVENAKAAPMFTTKKDRRWSMSIICTCFTGCIGWAKKNTSMGVTFVQMWFSLKNHLRQWSKFLSNNANNHKNRSNTIRYKYDMKILHYFFYLEKMDVS